jgi:hypothetical protein
MQQLSIQHTTTNQTIVSATPPTQTSDVHSVQSTNPKATQHLDGNKKQHKKGKGDKKPTNNVGGGNTKKWKEKYLCNMCTEEHPTHRCPWLAEAQKFITHQQPVVLTNPFQHGKNLTQASTSVEGVSQGPSPSLNNPTSANVYMMKGDSFISTRAHDYSKPITFEKGNEAEIPSLHLQIEKTLGETTKHIQKGVFKNYSDNPNARAY